MSTHSPHSLAYTPHQAFLLPGSDREVELLENGPTAVSTIESPPSRRPSAFLLTHWHSATLCQIKERLKLARIIYRKKNFVKEFTYIRDSKNGRFCGRPAAERGSANVFRDGHSVMSNPRGSYITMWLVPEKRIAHLRIRNVEEFIFQRHLGP